MTTHTCIAVYDGPTRAERAVKELLSADFDESQINVITRRPAATVPDATDALHDTSLGLVSATALGALYVDDFGSAGSPPGAGGLVVAGPLFAVLNASDTADVASVLDALGVSGDVCQFYTHAVAEGGALVAVQSNDPAQQNLAETIFERTGAEQFNHHPT